MRTTETQPNKNDRTMTTILAEINGNIASAFGLLGAALGVGLIGLKAAARYFGAHVDDRSLVPVGDARLGTIHLSDWVRERKQPASASRWLE